MNRRTQCIATITILSLLGPLGRAALAQPANDTCANAQFVTSGSYSFETTSATTDGPQVPCYNYEFASTHDLWYQVVADGPGLATIDTCGSAFDTTLAVYSGTCPPNGTVVSCNDDANSETCAGQFSSRLQFQATAGASYLIRVGGFDNSAVGAGVLNIAGPFLGSRTAFTYQGRLTQSEGPVNGPVEFSFKLFDATQGGSQFGPTVTRSPVNVVNGQFGVSLDFGQSALNLAPMYLEITANNALLSPRQTITAAPFASAVPWSGIVGIPGNVISAFSPWVNAGGGNVFLNNLAGRVALGRTDMPNAMLEIVAPNLVDCTRFVMTNNQGGGSAIRIRNTAASRDGSFRQSNDAAGSRLIAQNDANGMSSNPSFLGNDGNWSATSDARTKRDVQPMTGVLDKVLALRPVNFLYKNQDLSLDPERHIGFIAQEVEPLFPSVVSGRGEEMRSLSYASMSTVAIGAVQELSASMNNRLLEKDRQIADLQARLDRLEAAIAQPSR